MLNFYVLRYLYHRAENYPVNDEFLAAFGTRSRKTAGDPGYLGGRWWVDVNGDNIMDAGDSYLLCPLLGPRRTSPKQPISHPSESVSIFL